MSMNFVFNLQLDIESELSSEIVGNVQVMSHSDSESSASTQSRSCSTCKRVFETLGDQKLHYKSAEHVENVRKKVIESEEEESEDDDDDEDVLEDVDRSMLRVKLRSGDQVIIYKSIVSHSNSFNAKDLQKALSLLKDQKWAFLLLSGGRFAGAIYENKTQKMLHHKTFQRYTTRRKQGGSQSKHDNQGGRAKSVGAQIRRQNTQMLEEDVKEILTKTWKSALEECSAIWIHAPGKFNRSVINSSVSPAACVKTIPLSTRKPKLEEITRVYNILLTAKKIPV